MFKRLFIAFVIFPLLALVIFLALSSNLLSQEPVDSEPPPKPTPTVIPTEQQKDGSPTLRIATPIELDMQIAEAQELQIQVQEADVPPSVDPFPVRIYRCVDGDTLEGEIQLPYQIKIAGTLQLDDFDAPELTKRDGATDADVVQGYLAKSELEALLDSGNAYVVPVSNQADVYGLMRVRLYIHQRDGRWVDVIRALRGKGLEKQ